MKTYFIRNVRTGHIKIGRAKNPQARLKTLLCSSLDDLVIDRVEDGDIELRLHEYFKSSHHRGEWFLPGLDYDAGVAWARTVPPEVPKKRIGSSFQRLNFRCTYAEEERWKAEARKSGRSLSAWLRWLANTASQSPPLERVSLVGESDGLPPMPGLVSNVVPPPSVPRYEVQAELEDGIPVVWLNGEDIGYRGEPTLMELRASGIPGSVLTEIRKKLRELN